MFVVTAPATLAQAAADLLGIGSGLRTANAVVADPISEVAAAGADEVSAFIAALFSGHADSYRQLSAQMAAYHDNFVETLRGCGCAYAAAEDANASPLQLGGK
ncbi:PE family protein [Mycobacterium camsae]|uniref:PE family protein n=1 Tax=Mycobacterium gordonae TaxID=1778 RepID=UPI00240273A2|nr:PE family protein [Mycobacterium gordonae]